MSDCEEVKLGDIAFSISGKDNFAYVEKMTSKKNSKVYAIKKFDKNKNKNSKNFIRETQISIELDHSNLIKFYGYFEDKENIDKYRYVYKDDKKRKVSETEDKEMYCLVLEFAENGSLKNYRFPFMQSSGKCLRSFIDFRNITCKDLPKNLH